MLIQNEANVSLINEVNDKYISQINMFFNNFTIKITTEYDILHLETSESK